ncbi:ABC transporter ATP-binding protein [Caldicellulosiruptor morganii]|jgi:putative ABC transport system ATP-binding protein|uniref:ABC transporter ATP-binding protein n=1 Tax=Caldicellulosiruptor morganii TaxID=1387555 RepID=A0ABY7BPZ5_9FIRM|nr:ABC transporter ATP-binding protein [Caldicellulosiruptor morganii]WAM34898.1 ABC transporter ATP-binding protein [Caldicellulosiruptor morganii]
MQKSIILLSNISKSYKDGDKQNIILSKTSFAISKGEFVAMVGRSGLGKSTFLRIIGTIEKPDEGQVIIDGTDISNLNDKELTTIRRKKIGFVFQQFYLINRFSVKENLELPLFFSGVSKKERLARVKRILEIVGLAYKELDSKVFFLSGGEKQRLAIGRALINEPLILLADEPTGNLDEANEEQILSIFENINKELQTTIVVVTHNEKVAKRAQKVITISNKKIVQVR